MGKVSQLRLGNKGRRYCLVSDIWAGTYTMRSRQIQDALEGEWFRWRKANANVLKLKPQLPRKSLTHPEWYHMPRIFALPAHLAIGFVCPLNSLKDSSFFLFSRIYHSAWCVCVWGGLSHVQLFVTPWTAASQAPPSGHEYWRGLPFPSLGHLLDPDIKPASHSSPALAGGFFNTSATWEAWYIVGSQ